MKFIELFAGVGAFRLGLERTGHECVWANEWLERPRSIYARNFGEQPDGRDIRNVSAGDIPSADLLVGGFPCATFSVAGKRTGFSLDDTRGTLAFEMFRLARDKGIPYLLFENVKGLLNHDGGRTFEIILEVLDGMGYDCQWELLDSQNFGVPQHRERIFLIGHLRGESTRQIFPLGDFSKEVNNKELRQIGNIDQKGHNSLWGRVYNIDGIAPNLNANGGGMGAKTGLFAIVNDKGNFREVEQVTCIDANYWKGCDNHAQRTMVSIGSPKTLIRKLTPLECERLQGFPDNWTIGSDTQRYKQCGNAVTVNVVEYIANELS